MEFNNITTIPGKIRLQELDGTVASVIRLFDADKKAQKNPFLTEKIGELKNYSSDFNNAILQSKVYSTLAEKDDARDASFNAFCTACRAYSELPVKALSEKAQGAWAVCDKYRKAGLTAVSFVAESSQLESFFTDLEPFASDIAALEGLGEKLEELKSAQSDFALAYDGYIKGLGDKPAAASQLKKPILDCLNKELVPYLNAMLVSKSEESADFARNVASLFEKISSQTKKHAK